MTRQLTEHATALRSGGDPTVAVTARIAELKVRRQMSGQLEELVARRSELNRIFACITTTPSWAAANVRRRPMGDLRP